MSRQHETRGNARPATGPDHDVTHQTVLEGGNVVTPDRVLPDADLLVTGEVIEAVRSQRPVTASVDERVDVSGKYVLPGLVDLHGDDIERCLFPRSESEVDTATALTVCDRQNVAAGVTTKCHALAFEQRPAENRTLDRAAEVARTVDESTTLLGDHRIHARCELRDDGALEAVQSVLRESTVDIVSMMSHVPGSGQFQSEAAFEDRYGRPGGDSHTAEALQAARRDVSPETVQGRADALAAAARERDCLLAAHDVDSPTALPGLAGAGVSVCEFPTSLAVAERADDLGLTTVMGAPNLVRGGSLWGNLDATAAIGSGVVDVLSSDFRPYAMLLAPFVGTSDTLAQRVRRVSCNPADLLGLSNRGRLAPGARADVVVVDPAPQPTVERVFLAGADVFQATPREGRD